MADTRPTVWVSQPLIDAAIAPLRDRVQLRSTDTVTASGQVVRRCSSIDPVAASSSGLPSGRVRTGTRPATSWRAFAGPASLTVAAAARASAVRASSARDGPGRIS